MKCIKCGKDKNQDRLRRGMCISCYRKETGLSSGKVPVDIERDPLENEALEIVNLRQKVRLIEKECAKLPELKEELRQKMIEFSKKMELELK